MKSLAFRIVEQLIKKGYRWPGGPSNAKIYRTYCGWRQLQSWCWSWSLLSIDGRQGHPTVGSCERATAVAKGFTTYICRDGAIELFADPPTKKV